MVKTRINWTGKVSQMKINNYDDDDQYDNLDDDQYDNLDDDQYCSHRLVTVAYPAHLLTTPDICIVVIIIIISY